MSDFRFKISGDSGPFLAELYDAITCSKITSKIIEYSGLSTPDKENYTCVIFNGLYEETNYYAKVIDNIGNTALSITGQTPTNPIVIPTEININLLGTYYEPPQTLETICTLRSPKYIEITPAPIGNQCVTVNLSAVTCSSSSYSDAYIELYKKCTESGSYTSICTITNNTTNVDPIQIGEGDGVCYDLYTKLEDNITSADKYACAELQLFNTTASGYGSCYEINTTNDCLDISQFEAGTTTTTTTTLSPTVVYIDDINTNTVTFGQLKCGNINTYPAINSSQSFRVCFEIINNYVINETLPDDINQCGRILESNSLIDELGTNEKDVGTCTCRISTYIDIDSNNIINSNVNVNSLVGGSNNNYGCNYCEYQCIRICQITNMNNGNFIYGTSGYPSSICTYWDGNLQGSLNGGGGLLENNI